MGPGKRGLLPAPMTCNVRDRMKRHITSAITLSVVVFALSIALSGAPFKVHAVDALSLVIAFTIPAANIRKLGDIRQKWPRLFAYWILGTMCWYLLIVLVVVKAEINIDRLIAIVAASFIGMLLLLTLHLFFMWVTDNEQKGKPNDSIT
jgi:hypothetical protein